MRPRSVGEAAEMAATNPGSMFIAGGTDLVPNLKRRQFDAAALISLSKTWDGAAVLTESETGVTISAGARLADLADHPALVGSYRALAQACGLVSTPQIRFMGTLGGNLLVDPRCNYYNQTYAWRKAVGFCMKKDGDICLVAPGSDRCWAVSSSDTAPALWSLGASARLVGPAGARTVPVSALYRDDGIQYLAKRPDEILTHLTLPPADGWDSVYLKLRRRGSFDFPVLGVAVAVRRERDVVREARVVLGAVASTPREAPAAAAALV